MALYLKHYMGKFVTVPVSIIFEDSALYLKEYITNL